MNRVKRSPTHRLEIHLLREGIIESVHHVEAAICDDRGRVLSTAGSAETSAFIHSATETFSSTGCHQYRHPRTLRSQR